MIEGLWVLSIDLREGALISVHRSVEGAERELDEYIDSQWTPEDFDDVERPADSVERRQIYFEVCTGYEESYQLEYCPVQD